MKKFLVLTLVVVSSSYASWLDEATKWVSNAVSDTTNFVSDTSKSVIQVGKGLVESGQKGYESIKEVYDQGSEYLSELKSRGMGSLKGCDDATVFYMNDGEQQKMSVNMKAESIGAKCKVMDLKGINPESITKIETSFGTFKENDAKEILPD